MIGTISFDELRIEANLLFECLTSRTSIIVENQVKYGDSLLAQLREAITSGATSKNGSGGRSRTKSVISVEALDLWHWIQNQYRPKPADLFGRMQKDHIQMAGILETDLWLSYVALLRMITDKINNLLNPTRKWSINSACPQCGYKMMYVYNEQNELVLRHTLLIDETLSVTCHYCQATWPRASLEQLAVALGLPPLECLAVS